MSLRRSLLHGAVTLIAAGGLAGCGGGWSRIGPPVVSQQANAAHKSWMNPNATQSALLYVSDENAGTVSVYSYPDLTLTGTLTGFVSPTGLCVDPKTGNIWVTDIANSQVIEFAHGGTSPIRTLNTEGFDDACAVNPTNGDLAVVNNTVGGDGNGNLTIFRSRGPRRVHSDRGIFSMDFVTYDGTGNAFIDGYAYALGSGFRLDELLAGRKKLTHIAWSGPKIGSPGGVQYQGTSLAIGDARKPVIYQTSNGTVTGTTTLKGACSINQFFIDGGHLIAPSFCGSKGNVLIYNYPAGGAPIKKLTGFAFPFGAVVSRGE
jgi:hypothetical protein